MTTLDSLHGALHDPEKRKPIYRRLEMLIAICVMSGGWAAVGYGFGVKADVVRYETLRENYTLKVEKMRKDQASEIAKLQAQYSQGLGTTASEVAGAARSNAEAAKALAETAKKERK